MGSGRTKKSIVNIIGNFSQQIVTILLAFIARTVFIRTLGVEYLGINGLFTDILGLLSMADLGFNTAMVYSFYKPLAENNERKLAALTTFYKKVYNIIALTVAVIGLMLTPFIRLIVNTEREIPNLETYYLFSVASIVVSYLWVYKTSILTADQKNFYISRIQIISNFVKTILQVSVLYLFQSYSCYLALGVAFSFITNIVASRKAEKLYPYIKGKEALDNAEKKEIFSTIKSVFVFKLSSVLLNATDNTLISIIVGTAVVGYYSNYLMINTKLITLVSLVFSSVTASIGNLIVSEKAEKRYDVFQAEQTISFMFCGIVIPCYIALINDLITVWIGNDYCFPMMTVFVIAINLYMSCVMQPLWSYREATGLYTKTKWIMLVCAIMNIILSIVLGMWIGVVGILAASVLSRLFTYVWYEPKLLFRLYFEKSPASYFKGLICNFLGVIIYSSVLFNLSAKFIPTGWGSLIVKAVLLGSISCIGVIVLYSRTDGFGYIISRIKKRG